jgi:AcrR family transcriptional regulator
VDVTGNRRGPYAKSAVQKDKILRAALDYFGQQGFNAASMRELAREVGMSQPGLLHHFGTKTNLLIAVIDERDAISNEQVARRVEQTGSPMEGLIRVVEHNSENANLTRLFAIVSAEATHPDHPAYHYFGERSIRLIPQIGQLLESAAAAGEIETVDHVADSARLVTAMMAGLQVQWLQRPDLDMVVLFRRFLAATFPARTPR